MRSAAQRGNIREIKSRPCAVRRVGPLPRLTAGEGLISLNQFPSSAANRRSVNLRLGSDGSETLASSRAPAATKVASCKEALPLPLASPASAGLPQPPSRTAVGTSDRAHRFGCVTRPPFVIPLGKRGGVKKRSNALPHVGPLLFRHARAVAKFPNYRRHNSTPDADVPSTWKPNALKTRTSASLARLLLIFLHWDRSPPI
jgi:hypothetical protein